MTRSPDQIAYDEMRTFATEIDGWAMRVVAKPGVAGWEEIGAGTFLLAEAADVSREARVLVIGSAHGALGVALARRAAAGRVVVLDRNVVVQQCAQRTFAANEIGNASVLFDHTALGATPDAFDVATLEIPNDRKLARRWLGEAYATLKPGGALYLTGANRQGIKSIIKDAGDLFGAVDLLRYRQGHRVGRAIRGDGDREPPEWFREPGISPGTWAEYDVTARGHRLRVRSLPGVFSHGRLDDGTAFLLDAPGLSFEGRVLDLGCGSGVVGLIAAVEGAEQVDLVDANLLAVACVRENIARLGLGNARALAGDVIEPVRDQRYDVVVTNPPFHVGGETDIAVAHAFIAGAREVLRPGGRFYLVANRPLVYEPLLRARFATVARVAASNRYAVWLADEPLAPSF
ncbi:MAG: methyltransferase [Thermomicrobiales bacterium]